MCSLRVTRPLTTEWYSCWYSATLRPWISRSGDSEATLMSVSLSGEKIRGPMMHSGRTAALWTNRVSLSGEEIRGPMKQSGRTAAFSRLSCSRPACLAGDPFSPISLAESSAHSGESLRFWGFSHSGGEIWGPRQDSDRAAAFWVDGVTSSFLKALVVSCSVSLFPFCCSVNLACKNNGLKKKQVKGLRTGLCHVSNNYIIYRLKYVQLYIRYDLIQLTIFPFTKSLASGCFSESWTEGSFHSDDAVIFGPLQLISFISSSKIIAGDSVTWIMKME